MLFKQSDGPDLSNPQTQADPPLLLFPPVFTHAPCGSVGLQMNIFSFSFFFSTPLTGVSLRYHGEGGAWVLHWVCDHWDN